MFVNMDASQTVKDFVQKVLGCTCPDEVFERIEFRELQSSVSPHTRSLIIGERLLIYIWDVNEDEDLQAGIRAMLKSGKKERDARCLNRFRAVVAVAEPETVSLEINTYFTNDRKPQERMHVHAIHKDALKNL